MTSQSPKPKCDIVLYNFKMDKKSKLENSLIKNSLELLDLLLVPTSIIRLARKEKALRPEVPINYELVYATEALKLYAYFLAYNLLK